MASDKADKIFWLAYAAAIKQNVGAEVGKTNAFYLASKAQRGPPGGDNISEAYTNEGLHQIGNNLLPADNIFYNPSTSNSYIEQLQTYLAWVNVGGNPDPSLITQITNRRADLEAARFNKKRQLVAATADYESDKSIGLVGDQKFEQWIYRNAPAYTTADQFFQAMSAAYQNVYAMAYGPLAAKKLKDEAKLNSATNGVTPMPGFNMECYLGAPPSPRIIENAKTTGETLPEHATVLRPAFNCPGYNGNIQDAQAAVGKEKPAAVNFTLTMKDGKDVSETSFNESKFSGGAGFSYIPWLSVSARGSQSEQSEAIETESEMEEISITVFYDKMELVPINPSASWDINPKDYSGLLPGAPDRVKTLVKPTQLLLATRLGYKVKLGTEVSKVFDTKHKETTSTGGSINVLGIPCGLGADFEKGTDNSTHCLKWDKQNREITVEPTNNAGFATIVGVMGEKIDVSG